MAVISWLRTIIRKKNNVNLGGRTIGLAGKKSTSKRKEHYRNGSKNGSFFREMGHVVVMLYFPYENGLWKNDGFTSRLNNM